MNKTNFKTEQEAFWAGSFGDAYIQRNQSEELLASNLNFFSQVFRSAARPEKILEFGANVGMNLRALQILFPGVETSGVEINEKAAAELATVIKNGEVFQTSILDFEIAEKCDVSLIKGVLIHINPDELPAVYDKLYNASSRYVVVAEYYNPSPVSISYRGHSERLFKRDFAGEMLSLYPDLTLVDYGFAYHKDPKFSQDDITWFLLEKR